MDGAGGTGGVGGVGGSAGDDGAGGLVTRNRVSPYALAAAGVPLQSPGAGRMADAPERAGMRSFGLSDKAMRAVGLAS